MLAASCLLALAAARALPTDASPVEERPRTSMALAWHAPTECGESQEFFARLIRLTQRELTLDVNAETRVEILVETDGEGYRIHVSTEGLELANRDFQARECREGLDTAALIVVSRLATLRRSVVPEPPGSVTSDSATAPDALPAPAPGSAQAQPPSRALPEGHAEPISTAPRPSEQDPRVLAGADAGVADVPPERRSPSRRASMPPLQIFAGGAAGPALGGLGPGWTGAMRLHVGLGGSRFRGEILGLRVFAKRAAASENAAATIRLTALGIRGCWTPRRPMGALSVPLCIGTDIGIATATPDPTLVDRRRGTQLWASSSASAGLSWSIHAHAALRFSATLLGMWQRPRFFLADGDELRTVYRSAAIGGMLEAGIEVRFSAKTRQQGGA